VLLYVTAADLANADRTERLISAGGTLSVQVLNEITDVGRRKMGMSWTKNAGFSLDNARLPADAGALSTFTKRRI
jgi:predicted nucleic acid-binding protein